MTVAWDCQLKLIPPLTRGEKTLLLNPLHTLHKHTLKLSHSHAHTQADAHVHMLNME